MGYPKPQIPLDIYENSHVNFSETNTPLRRGTTARERPPPLGDGPQVSYQGKT